ncbi:hypothetical protein WN48_08588 [Eufriesea mexicana]|nr:hypothetical protein WN48_08588 [Eufriesea mexicana]
MQTLAIGLSGSSVVPQRKTTGPTRDEEHREPGRPAPDRLLGLQLDKMIYLFVCLGESAGLACRRDVRGCLLRIMGWNLRTPIARQFCTAQATHFSSLSNLDSSSSNPLVYTSVQFFQSYVTRSQPISNWWINRDVSRTSIDSSDVIRIPVQREANAAFQMQTVDIILLPRELRGYVKHDGTKGGRTVHVEEAEFSSSARQTDYYSAQFFPWVTAIARGMLGFISKLDLGNGDRLVWRIGSSEWCPLVCFDSDSIWLSNFTRGFALENTDPRTLRSSKSLDPCNTPPSKAQDRAVRVRRTARWRQRIIDDVHDDSQRMSSDNREQKDESEWCVGRDRGNTKLSRINEKRIAEASGPLTAQNGRLTMTNEPNDAVPNGILHPTLFSRRAH